MSRAESHFFSSVPETWVIFVSLKISLNFILKLSLGVTKTFNSWLKRFPMSNETFSSKLRTGTENLSDLFIASQLGREASDNESQFKVITPVLFIRMRNALSIIWTSFVHDFSRGACFFFFHQRLLPPQSC